MITEGKSRYRPFLLLASLGIVTALLASGCLWGVVRDANTGAPVAGASVSCTDSNGHVNSATTNVDGWYAFDIATGPVPAAGPATFQVSAPGYQSLSVPRLVEYKDNPKADPANLSSFWEVQNFTLVPAAAQLPAADLAVTDLYPDKGWLYAGVTNHGPDTLTNVAIELSCGYTRTEWATGIQGFNGLTLPVTVSLSPGQTAAFNTTLQLDTAKYWYDAVCGTQVPFAGPATFNDTNASNDYYYEYIPPAAGDLELQLVSLGSVTNEVYFKAAKHASLSGTFTYQVYANGALVIQANATVPAGSQAFWTGYNVTGTQTIRVVIDPFNVIPETNENNNEMTKTCSAASHTCW